MSAVDGTSRSTEAWLLAKCTDEAPTLETFRKATVPLRELAAGEVLVKPTFFSVDPYLRFRMMAGNVFGCFGEGNPIESEATGVVLASKDPSYKEGDTVVNIHTGAKAPWQREFILPGESLMLIDTPDMDPSMYLGVLGMVGLTAYFGLLEICHPKPGETVFVSGAAGAVGSVAGQIAKILGCKVIGCAGTDEKVAFIKSLGFDGAFNYKSMSIEEGLSTYAPSGIDVYFDNVRGPILDTALLHMNEFGRIALCGGISEYTVDPDKQYGLKNLGMATGKQLTLQGFLVGRYYSKFREGIAAMQGWIRQGKLKHKETIREGFGELPDAFLGLFRGDNTGKMLVKV